MTGGTSTIPIDVWVDAEHLVRREHVGYPVMIQGQRAAFDVTVDDRRFGVPVDVKPPADGDTLDASKLPGFGAASAG